MRAYRGARRSGGRGRPRVDGLADETPGQTPDEALPVREEPEARAAVREWQPQALPLRDRDVDAGAARRPEQRQRQRLGGCADDQRTRAACQP